MSYSDAPGMPSPRRRPIFGAIAVMCSLSGVVGAFYWIRIPTEGLGALGTFITSALSIGAGSSLGALAGIIAIIRKERWLVLHVGVFLINVVSAAWIVWLFGG
jgi:hypothetical protein